MIKILVAEDQAMVLGALVALLEIESDFEVRATALNGEIAFKLLKEQAIDIVLTDIEMPKMSGLDLAIKIKEHHIKTRVIILTTFSRPGFLRRALDAGVTGYLLKDSPSEKLANAIRTVHSGGRSIDPELALEAWTDNNPLTDNERLTLKLAGEGMTSKEISKQIHLAEGTVRNYLSEAISKLDANNRIDAYRIARQKGWL
ncbi:MAG: response regulator transcription factor [Thermodesulfovibrionales bacterium]|nr:response regulator transcription factor [Thermodesulfovibrionales bacterium]